MGCRVGRGPGTGEGLARSTECFVTDGALMMFAFLLNGKTKIVIGEAEGGAANGLVTNTLRVLHLRGLLSSEDPEGVLYEV